VDIIEAFLKEASSFSWSYAIKFYLVIPACKGPRLKRPLASGTAGIQELGILSAWATSSLPGCWHKSAPSGFALTQRAPGTIAQRDSLPAGRLNLMSLLSLGEGWRWSESDANRLLLSLCTVIRKFLTLSRTTDFYARENQLCIV